MAERNRCIGRQRNAVASHLIVGVRRRTDDPVKYKLLQSGDGLALDATRLRECRLGSRVLSSY
ncbi:hypothetical protein [Rhizobium sp. BR 362]|uniref:hypothetical protein n=1 Tax=Rhizobium sp. BR 362 TaxID=3040670 RepID=UPI002F42C1B6